jgi:hypothetical protein
VKTLNRVRGLLFIPISGAIGWSAWLFGGRINEHPILFVIGALGATVTVLSPALILTTLAEELGNRDGSQSPQGYDDRSSAICP